jgi:hypothetical protein
MTKGILGYLTNPERASESVDTAVDILGVTLYQSKTRQAIIDFCGWFPNRSKNTRKNKRLEEKCALVNNLE